MVESLLFHYRLVGGPFDGQVITLHSMIMTGGELRAFGYARHIYTRIDKRRSLTYQGDEYVPDEE